MREVVRAWYEIETPEGLEHAAAVMASEQSTGTFVTLAGETAELRDRHAALVSAIHPLEPSGRSPLPGTVESSTPLERGLVAIDFPVANVGTSLSALGTAVAGNLFELPQLGAIRLVDLELPDSYTSAFVGPRHGVIGTRRAADRPTGPLLGTIIKPSIGLAPEALGRLVEELALAGIDFIKDDELQSDLPDFGFAERLDVVSRALDRAEANTGRRPIYAFNVTDDMDRMAAKAEAVARRGGSCVMVCAAQVSLAGLRHVHANTDLIIHAHRAGFGAISRSPQLGVGFRAYQKLARLSGADHLHTNGIANKFYESDAEVLAAIDAVREPLLGGFTALPVLSSGQSAGLAHATYAACRTDDLLVLAGGGIHGHPDGAAAGVAAMRAAWAAATAGTDLDTAAASHPELAVALSTFGRRDRIEAAT